MEVLQIRLQIALIFKPRHTIHSNRRRLLQTEERTGQQVFIDMMQQGRELELAVLAGSSTHTFQPV
jgi:hypothetical protein